jgi:pimeloyl-ACP methyl ester carboxylesterase
MSMSEPKTRQAKGDGITIQLAEWPGAEKTILCVHGLSANCRWWDIIATALAPQYHVLALDIRGRGLSDKPSTGYSLAHHGRDIQALLDDLSLDRVVLMGHSLGAFIASAFAAEHPDRVERLILVDGGGQLSAEQSTKVLAGVKPSVDRLGRLFPSFEASLHYLKQSLPVRPWLPSLDIPYRYDTEEVGGGVRCRVQLEHIQEEISNLSLEDVTRFYPKLCCPVLILRATEGMFTEDDLLLPQDVVQRMLQEIPRAQCVNVPACNHYTIVFRDSKKRDQALRAFLAT